MTTETITRVRRQTLEDFRALPEGTPAQLIDGEIIMSPAPTFVHQHVVLAIATALESFVRREGAGVAFVAPVDVHLAEALVVQPDVGFVASGRRQVIRDDGVHGAPDLLVEVLSLSTAYYDLVKKREAYERFGVREYWIIDPERHAVEVLVLEDGRFTSRQQLRDTGTAQSALLTGFAVDLDGLFEIPGAGGG